jgi:cell division protein FtsB
MTRADNSAFLAQANARRHEAALRAAHQAIERLQSEGRAVSFGALARTAGVSRGWLYRQEELKALVLRLRTETDHATTLPAQRASNDSLRQRIDAMRAEVSRLRAENSALREQLARRLGLRRAQADIHALGEPR